MATKKDISKLFQESFNEFSMDNSPQIEALMKQKLKKSKMILFGKKIAFTLITFSIVSLITIFWYSNNDGTWYDSSMEPPQKLENEQNLTNTIIESNEIEKGTSESNFSNINEIALNNSYSKKEESPKEIVLEKNVKAHIHKESPKIEKKNIKFSEDNTENELKFLKSKKVANLEFNMLRHSIVQKPSEASSNKKPDKKKKTKKYHVSKHQQRKPTHMIPSKYTGQLDVGLSTFTFNNRLTSQLPSNDTIISSAINVQPQLSYGFGLDFQLMNKQRPLFIQLGIHYQNYREKVDYQFIREYIDHEKSYWDCDSIFEYHINPPFFDTILARIDSNYMEYVVRNEYSKKHINTYQYLSIPLMIGYQIDRLYSPFKFEFSVGMNLAVLLRNQGYYYNNDGYIIDFTSHSTSVFLQYNMMAQIGIYYQWRNINLFARPYFQYQLNKNEWNPPLQGRKYLVYGLNFGLRFKMF